MKCTDATQFISSDLWDDVSPSLQTVDNSFWVEESITTRKAFSIPLIHFLFAPSISSNTEEGVFVSGQTDSKDGGVETPTCGWMSLPCLRISTAFEHRGEKSLISLEGNTHTSAENTQTTFPSSSSLTVKARDTSKKPSKIVSSLTSEGTFTAVFKMEGTSATFEAISFSLDTTENNRLNIPLFYAANGRFTLTSISVSSSTEDPVELSASLIVINGASESVISSSTFSLLSLSSGSGSAIHATLGQTDSLSITGEENQKTFTSCSAQKKGGAIYVNAGSSDKFYLTTVTFDECSVSEGKGSHVYIESSTADTLITADKWGGTIDRYDGEEVDLYWIAGTTSLHPPLPLRTLFADCLSHPRWKRFSGCCDVWMGRASMWDDGERINTGGERRSEGGEYEGRIHQRRRRRK